MRVSKKFLRSFERYPLLACFLTILVCLVLVAFPALVIATLISLTGLNDWNAPIVVLLTLPAILYIGPTFFASFFLLFEMIAMLLGLYFLCGIKGQPVRDYMFKT